MHILIYASWYPSALNPVLGSFIRDQATALTVAGMQVGVVALNHLSVRDLADRRLHDDRRYANEHGIHTYRAYDARILMRAIYGDRYLHGASKDRLFGRYVADHGMPDLIHAHTTLFGGVLAARIKRRHGLPLVITEHNSAYASPGMPLWLDRLAAATLRSADARLVVSRPLGRLLEARYGDRIVPWEWVPNIVDERFQSVKPGSSSDHATFRFLNVANLVEVKGHVNLLHAFARRFRADSGVELRIGGGGPLEGELRQLTRALGIEAQVTFLGPLDRAQVAAEMQGADAFVLSSDYESFGVVLIEALACGKPVVATDCGGPGCIVHQANGVLVPSGRPDELGAAMAGMRERIGQYDSVLIQRDCLDRFGSARVVQRLTTIYEDVLATAQRRGTHTAIHR
jgi:glycosyltransferase involved in cell wall biosynthesis